MKVIDIINRSESPLFSIELLPPVKGNSIERVYSIVDKLREFEPRFINIHLTTANVFSARCPTARTAR